MILSIPILFVLLLPTCLSLRGPPGSICHETKIIRKTRLVSYTAIVTYRCKFVLVCTKRVIQYKPERYIFSSTRVPKCCSNYTNNGGTCQPVCSSSCVNGRCTAPGICICNPGFEYNTTTTNCQPVCASPCVNGFCNGPNICQCFPGYNKLFANSSICEPICENCDHGTCRAPHDCVCNVGFIKDATRNGTCVPTCQHQCVHGTCTAEGCNCFYGWRGVSCNEPSIPVMVERYPINITARRP